MKKIILSLALLFCMGCAFGQEADKLIAKYKAMEGMTYKDITSEFKSVTDWGSEEKERAARNIDKVEVMMGLFENDPQEESLTKELEGLKGFEALVDVKHNSDYMEEGALPGPLDIIKKVQVFAKQEDERIKELIQLTQLQEMFFLIHIKGNLTMEDMELLMAEDSHVAVNMSNIEKVEDSDVDTDSIVAVLIDGIFYPNLTNEKAAMDFLFGKGYLLDKMKVSYNPASEEDIQKYGKLKKLVLKIDTSEAEKQAQTADMLMNKYKGMDGFKYENMTEQVRGMKEENDPDMYRISREVTKVEYLVGVLSSDKLEQLQNDLDELIGFERVYYEKHNGNDDYFNVLKGGFKLFHNKQYYAVEDGEYFKDLIVRIDADANEGNIVTLIRIKGSIKPADVPLMIGIEESTTVDVKKQEE